MGTGRAAGPSGLSQGFGPRIGEDGCGSKGDIFAQKPANFRGADFSDLYYGCVERADGNSEEEISRNVKHYEIRVESSICCTKSRNFVFCCWYVRKVVGVCGINIA